MDEPAGERLDATQVSAAAYAEDGEAGVDGAELRMLLGELDGITSVQFACFMGGQHLA